MTLRAAVLLLLCAPALAAPPPAYRAVAAEVGVPARLLWAIAHQESRMRHKSGVVAPYPWSLNACGKPERHPSRIEAHRAILRHLQAGCRSIDIGAAQVNWRWHADKLRDPWLALDPWHNLRTSAQILLACYRRTGTWNQAAGCYHHPSDQTRARKYAEQVAQRIDN